MPTIKKGSSKKTIQNKGNTGSVKQTLQNLGNTNLLKYVKRQNERRARENLASERYSEYSGKGKSREKLRDIHDPVPLKERSREKFRKISAYLKAHKTSRDERAVRHINPRTLLWILVAVCLALIILSGVSEKVRKPFKDIASVIVVPAQKGINSIGLWLSDKLEAQRTLAELEEENRKLQEEIDSLSVTITTLKQKEQELSRLQDLLKLEDRYADYDMVAARIIAKDSGKWYSTFTIDKGENHGITKDMNVIASGGLVGIITDVGKNFSTVRSIIDDESSVSAQFESTLELCLLNGSLPLMERNLLEFTNVGADVFITLNDAVLTSHVSSRYLPGILIGYVEEYRLDANNLTQSGYIKPAVDFANLEEVMILTKTKEVSD